MTRPESDLAVLLAGLDPVLADGVWVFSSLAPGAESEGLDALATFREAEGTTVVVAEAEAARAGLAVDFRSEWITLRVHSDLAAVGLTAAVASALADAGISCNVIAAARHDHLFVPSGRGRDALALLVAMQEAAARRR